jgi:hypothetical protein
MPNACDYGYTAVVNGETLRLFTRSECENTIGGTFAGNGECLKKEGGSYSYDCRNEQVSGLSSLLSGGAARSVPQWAWWVGGAGAAYLAWKTMSKK